MDTYEKIHTIQDWWDGPREGVADYKGKPHVFTRVFDEDLDDYSDFFLLTPITEEEFHLIMEGNEIWKRWVMDFEERLVPLSSHPCLPEERARYEEIKALTQHLFDANQTSSLSVMGEVRWNPDAEESKYRNFSFQPLEMKWG